MSAPAHGLSALEHPAPRQGGMVARDRAEAHRTSTPFELLFDLCFVVAIAQAGSELHHGLAAGHVFDAVRGWR